MAEPFPIASDRDFLMLYPAGEDGLELRWRFKALSSRAASSAFSDQGRPSVRLQCFESDHKSGQSCGDNTAVDSLHQGRLGFRDLLQDVWYQAEIGLGNPDGGWLMLARSNRLALPRLESHEPSARPITQETKPTPPAVPAVVSARVHSDTPGSPHPLAGSGPVISPRARVDDLALWGELRIIGHAPPGSALNLGGHAYRVGPGGHFAFDLQLMDAELIHALLRQLPALPVEEREAK